MIFTPRSWAWWYGRAPMNAGRNEWWMLMIRFGHASVNDGVRICM